MGNYRIEYDGKYVALFGADKNYPITLPSDEDLTKDVLVGYEEMVLVPCLIEQRNITPEIVYKYHDHLHMVWLIVALNPEE